MKIIDVGTYIIYNSHIVNDLADLRYGGVKWIRVLAVYYIVHTRVGFMKNLLTILRGGLSPSLSHAAHMVPSSSISEKTYISFHVYKT